MGFFFLDNTNPVMEPVKKLNFKTFNAALENIILPSGWVQDIDFTYELIRLNIPIGKLLNLIDIYFFIYLHVSN